MREVYITGVGITPFRRELDSTLPSLSAQATRQAMTDAAVGADEVGMVFFGNAMAGIVTGQEMIRAQTALRDTGLLGTPMVSVENACASSSSAAHLAWLAVASGQVEVALAVGAEKMTSSDKTQAFRGLASAVDLGHTQELEEHLYGAVPQAGAGQTRSLFMDIYARGARDYMQRSAATPDDFARVVVKNHQHGSMNPVAQRRTPVSVEEVLASREISDPLTLLMCSPIGDGAAALVFTSADRAAQATSAPVRVRASVLVSGHIEASDLTAVERASTTAYEMASVGPDDLDVAEVHDAAAPAELLVYEELGLCAPGEAPSLLRDGVTSLGGRLPVNPSGGLLSKGHPVGATGCAQLVELTEQLRGHCGDRQVQGARVALAENGGGFLNPDPAACVITILSAD